MEKYYVANVSGGKDSMAMFLLLYRKGYPVNEVVFFDTGWEFDCIYENLRSIEYMCYLSNIRFSVLHPAQSFEYLAFEYPHKNRAGQTVIGYSWCGGRCRWGTTQKTTTIKKHFQQPQYKNKEVYHYIGLAADEEERIAKNTDPHKLYPLAKHGITEQQALNICLSEGYKFEENGVPLYSILKRVSCWCCANKNLTELMNYYRYLPKYWEQLKEYQKRTDRPFKGKGKSVFDLEKRFMKEMNLWEK